MVYYFWVVTGAEVAQSGTVVYCLVLDVLVFIFFNSICDIRFCMIRLKYISSLLVYHNCIT